MFALSQDGHLRVQPRLVGEAASEPTGGRRVSLGYRFDRGCRLLGRGVAGPVLGAVLLWTAPGLEAAAAKSAKISEPMMAEIPDACGYLTATLASGLVRAKVRPGPANEHIPNFWSQCVYLGQGVRGRQVSFVFKFMTWDLFDVASLDPEQLEFNAGFVVGNLKPREKRNDLGKVAFVYEKQARTILLVVTGFQGPPDGAKRPTELVATYELADPETAHDVRLAKLLTEARRHLNEWRTR